MKTKNIIYAYKEIQKSIKSHYNVEINLRWLSEYFEKNIHNVDKILSQSLSEYQLYLNEINELIDQIEDLYHIDLNQFNYKYLLTTIDHALLKIICVDFTLEELNKIITRRIKEDDGQDMWAARAHELLKVLIAGTPKHQQQFSCFYGFFKFIDSTDSILDIDIKLLDEQLFLFLDAVISIHLFNSDQYGYLSMQYNFYDGIIGASCRELLEQKFAGKEQRGENLDINFHL